VECSQFKTILQPALSATAGMLTLPLAQPARETEFKAAQQRLFPQSIERKLTPPSLSKDENSLIQKIGI
jgi:hypothetical protein